MGSIAKVAYECSKLINAPEETLVGTRVVLALIAAIIETAILLYIVNKLFYQRAVCKMHKALSICFVGYHLSIALYFGMTSTVVIEPMFRIHNIHDFTSLSTCHVVNMAFFIPFWLSYSCLILFWYFRLRIVFSGTIYQLSDKFYKYTTIWIVSQMSSTIVLIIAVYAWIFVLSVDDTYKPTDLFCIRKYDIVDFFPYVITDKDDSSSYSDLIDNFLCLSQSNICKRWQQQCLSIYLVVEHNYYNSRNGLCTIDKWYIIL